MRYYQEERETVLSALDGTAEGLSQTEAQRRLAVNGKNKLVEAEKISNFRRFLRQLADPMILVLLAAAGLSAITSAYAGESFADVWIILFVVILNSVLGVVQESKAEAAMEALKNMTPITSKVLRDGQLLRVKSEELVVGDVVLLEAGDAVPADARLLECASMKAEEAALTGESVPVGKLSQALEGAEELPLGDRKNMVYMGSSVVHGWGKAVVCATGMDTEMGKIAAALAQAEDEATPLQRRLAELSRLLTWLVLGLSALIFVVGVLRTGSFSTDVMLDTFMLAVSLAVAAIPEGLAAVVTIVLSIGVTKMSRNSAIIRRMTAVETLGCAQIICSDKTGTITQNKMTVVEDHSADSSLLATAMALCSDAQIGENGEVLGEPTECALVAFARDSGLDKRVLVRGYPRIGEAPFDSERKMMSTVHEKDGAYHQFTKGAPDVVLHRCTHILTAQGVAPLTEERKKAVLAENKAMADKALRVLGAAYRDYAAAPAEFDADALEQGMTFLGLVGMIDPIRPEVQAAVDKCAAAGIRVIMITGDHVDTAVAIASTLGILSDPSQAVTGQQLGAMSDDELYAAIERYSVYARVQPDHKTRIVRAWKKRGAVTAMTGDGVNDAPSIKSADIGIGMGITGTDVAKNAADMILADDNFATIVCAVEEGRRIYANIQRTVQYLLSSNLSEVMSVLCATLIGFTILRPAHMLWINLITDSLPALALGMESGEPDAMQRQPRDTNAGIFSGGVGFDIAYQGVGIGLLTLGAYVLGHYMENGVWTTTQSADGVTMAFLTMSMAEIFQSFNMRSQRGSIFTLKRQNLYLWGAALLALVLTTAVISVPFLAQAFGFTEISLREYLAALALAFLIIPLVELVKLLRRRFGR